jgi:hypothetical protein
VGCLLEENVTCGLFVGRECDVWAVCWKRMWAVCWKRM